MAQKKATTATKKVVTTDAQSGLKLVRLELTPALHQQFRVESAKEGLPMAVMARKLVADWVAKRGGGGK
jgi:hypothetical protein